jgi:hypothetical protein
LVLDLSHLLSDGLLDGGLGGLDGLLYDGLLYGGHGGLDGLLYGGLQCLVIGLVKRGKVSISSPLYVHMLLRETRFCVVLICTFQLKIGLIKLWKESYDTKIWP